MSEFKKIGASLKKLRLNEGLSFEQAAALSKVAKSTIQRIEQGDNGVSLGTLFSYIECLGGSYAVLRLTKSFEELPSIISAEKDLQKRKEDTTALLLKISKKG